MRRHDGYERSFLGLVAEGGFWIFAFLVIATPVALATLKRGVDTRTPDERLHDALSAGRTAELARLLPVDQPLSANQCQLLPEAVSYGRRDAVQLLLDRGVDVDTVQATSGGTPLVFAAYRSDRPMVLTLLRHGADVNRRAGGQYPLLAAAAGDDAGIVHLLLDAGARVDARNRRGQTALAIAAEAGSPDMVALLLSYGARVNARDDEQLTPLMLAAAADRRAAVTCLLQAGADPSLRDRSGRTARDRALVNGHTALADLLSQF